MPRMKTEKIGTGDQSWLGSTHGIYNCITVTIDPQKFTKETHYKNGYLPSGLAVNIADQKAVKPYTGAAGEKLGFLYTDQTTDGTTPIGAPVLTHGIIRKDKLPVALASTEKLDQLAPFVIV